MGVLVVIFRAAVFIVAGVGTSVAMATGGPFLFRGRVYEAADGMSVWESRTNSLSWCEWHDRQLDHFDEDLDLSAEVARERARSRTYVESDGCGPCGNYDGRIRHWRIFETGWPCRAFWGWDVADQPEFYSESTDWAQHDRFVIRISSADERIALNGEVVLPYCPLWPGLIANTLIFATSWWALVATPIAIRRVLRRRRGLCPACGYDCSASGMVCPECGAGVSPATTQSPASA